MGRLTIYTAVVTKTTQNQRQKAKMKVAREGVLSQSLYPTFDLGEATWRRQIEITCHLLAREGVCIGILHNIEKNTFSVSLPMMKLAFTFLI